MTDFYKMSAMMKDLFPSDPIADQQALKQMANAPVKDIAPTRDYVNESVEVPQGSMPLGIDSVSDFAKLAGVVSEKQNTGSAGQAKGSDPMPKMSKPSSTGEQPHPLKDKLVGEDEIDILKLTPAASTVGGAINPELDDSALIARGLKKAAKGDVLNAEEREAIAPYVELMSELMTNPAFRNNLIAMDKVLKKSKNKEDSKAEKNKKEESIKERLYRELNKYR